MSDEFVDTNILVYFAESGEAKYRRASELLQARPTISVQVLNEFAAVGRRKLGLGWAALHEALTLFRSLTQVNPISIETHETGLLLAEAYGLHIYDAMIVASALQAGCSTLWSEDMQHGLLIEGRLYIRNPFA